MAFIANKKHQFTRTVTVYYPSVKEGGEASKGEFLCSFNILTTDEGRAMRKAVNDDSTVLPLFDKIVSKVEGIAEVNVVDGNDVETLLTGKDAINAVRNDQSAVGAVIEAYNNAREAATPSSD